MGVAANGPTAMPLFDQPTTYGCRYRLENVGPVCQAMAFSAEDDTSALRVVATGSENSSRRSATRLYAQRSAWQSRWRHDVALGRAARTGSAIRITTKDCAVSDDFSIPAPEQMPEFPLWRMRKGDRYVEARTRTVREGPELRVYVARLGDDTIHVLWSRVFIDDRELAKEAEKTRREFEAENWSGEPLDAQGPVGGQFSDPV
jgi:hypothetical protein